MTSSRDAKLERSQAACAFRDVEVHPELFTETAGWGLLMFVYIEYTYKSTYIYIIHLEAETHVEVCLKYMCYSCSFNMGPFSMSSY